MEPTNQVVCADCTTPYAPDAVGCPHCGTPNPGLEEHLAGVTTFDASDFAADTEPGGPATPRQPPNAKDLPDDAPKIDHNK